MSTLSDYNNNPGNLRPPKGVTYEGQIGVDDKGFAVFENKDYGQKALINDVQFKIKNGVDTPEKFVNKFSPAGDNDEEARENYKIYLAQQLGLKSTNDPFPKDAADRLAKAVGAFEGGTWMTPQQEQKKAPEAPSATGFEPETVPPESDSTERVVPKHSSDLPGASERYKPAGALVGAVTGAGLAGSIETGKQLLPLVPNIINKMGGKPPDINQPMSRASLQRYLNSQIAENLRLPLTELEKVSGAGKIRTMSEVQQALNAIQAAEEKKTAKPVYKMVEGRPGVYEQTGKFTTHTVPGRSAVDLTPYEVKPSGPIRQAISRQAQTAGEVGRAVLPSVGRIGLGALGGANMMMTGYDAWEMAQKLREMNDPSWVDYARLASKTAATAGGFMSMFPLGGTQVLGGFLQAPEAIVSGVEALNEARKNATKEQTDRALTHVDPLGNPVGGLP